MIENLTVSPSPFRLPIRVRAVMRSLLRSHPDGLLQADHDLAKRGTGLDRRSGWGAWSKG
jgi:hypothetical protein